jgi:hypothetical protein
MVASIVEAWVPRWCEPVEMRHSEASIMLEL